MNMKMMWRIREDMENQGYDWPDWVGKASYQCNYTPYRESHQLYRGWKIDSHAKFSSVPVSHDDFPNILSAFSFSSSTLPSPEKMKLSHCSLSLHAIIKS
jgi:hypothetical protein